MNHKDRVENIMKLGVGRGSQILLPKLVMRNVYQNGS